jgi:2-polyprenyl-6-methoxyphenol hydroxylase-like FAD-dependent oxidoreductase
VGPVLFIGDAAHGTSPQLGQGANLGLLDAHVLARSVAEAADLPSALALFARRRSAAVRFYRQASHLLTPFFQSRSTALGLARDLFMGLSCRVPQLRGFMTSTLAGVRRGWLGADPLDAQGRYRFASDAQRPGVSPKRATK